MKKIQLKQVHITNFKGIKDLVVDFGSITNIKAENAKGKTTVFDAFCWVLFGKDSRGNSKFHLRPIDKDGKDIDFLEISATLVLDVNDKEISLKKTQRQKWVKKRGSEEQTFEGNVNEFEWNGFPKSEADYNASISEIITDTIFMMVTNPAYFPGMKWKDQRDTLLKLAGEVQDTDVIATNPKFQELNTLLEINSLDAWKEKYTKAIKEYNRQIDGIPGRIDEASRNIKEVDYSAEESRIQVLKKELLGIDEKLENAAKAYEEVAKRQQDYFGLKTKLRDMENQGKKNHEAGLQELRLQKDSLDGEFNRLFLKDSSIKSDIVSIHSQIESSMKELETSRERFENINGETLSEESCTCPTCGQALPEAKAEQIRGEFQANKRNRLQAIRDNGHNLNHKIQGLSEKEEQLQRDLQETIEKKAIVVGQVNAVKAKIDGYPSFDKYNVSGLIELQVEVERANAALSANSGESLNQELKEKRKAVLGQIEEVNKILNGKQVIEDAKNRVKELTQEQRELAQKVADTEKVISLIEEFTREKMNLLSEAVNHKFQLVNWKLFDMQINGGMKETCELTVNGVPYLDLNNAGKIQAGLDIINTMSRIYEVTAPVFIDNREGINEIPEVDVQVINLIVLPKEIPADTEIIL